MALFTNFGIGVSTYGDAHRLIKKHRLWGYVLLPGVINIILFIFVFIAGWHYSDVITHWLFDILGLDKEPTGFLKYLFIALHFVLGLIFKVLFILFYLAIYRYIVLIILSPALALLSERAEQAMFGTKYPFDFKQLLKDILRGALIALRNVFVEFFFMIIFFFVSYIPIIGFISPICLFLVSCYFYGFSMIDYSNERHRLRIGESVLFVRKSKGLAIANGMIFYLILLIPFVGLLFAPSYAVVAATIATEKIRQKDQLIIIQPDKAITENGNN
ncbi:MAG: EI24 domain-containing protein [Bacteroidetes bacterium]|nr:EI24 domain-containing protein [Bacteroidota bacterium]